MHCCCSSSAAQLGLALADRNPWGCSQHQWGPLFLRSQMPSPSSPHAERVLCVHNQPLGRSELGNKTRSLSPGRAWCPPGLGEGWGQRVRGGV